MLIEPTNSRNNVEKHLGSISATAVKMEKFKIDGQISILTHQGAGAGTNKAHPIKNELVSETCVCVCVCAYPCVLG